MQKTVFSLTTVLALFAGVPVYTSSIVSASEVSVRSIVTDTEPQIQIAHLPTLDISYESEDFIDGRNLPRRAQTRTSSNSVNKGEMRRFQRYQLAKGQKLIATIHWYDKSLSDGSEETGWYSFKNRGSKPLQRVEKHIEKDGFYAIELVTPSAQFDVNLYHVMCTIRVE